MPSKYQKYQQSWPHVWIGRDGRMYGMTEATERLRELGLDTPSFPSSTKKQKFRYNPHTYMWEMKQVGGPWLPMDENHQELQEYQRITPIIDYEEYQRPGITPRIDYDTFGHPRELRYQEYQESISPRTDYDMFDYLRELRRQEEYQRQELRRQEEYQRQEEEYQRRYRKYLKNMKRVLNNFSLRHDVT